MRLLRLLLRAFGPFTEAELDLGPRDPTRPDLHLVYGPNEAGKSSALRAIGDLRFGIPVQSPDGFLHDFPKLRIGGVFEDDQGQSVGLLRRKGRGATLSLFHPDSAAEAGEPPAALAQALTAGLDRDGFEALFGLNHERLREGGARLLRGEGELGSALFEASAGTRGIAAILAALEKEAKERFNPNSRDQSAAFNEGRRALEEQRQALRAAQTRPADWQALSRAQAQAREALAEVDHALEAQRRRDKDLTVLPLLRDRDLAEAELAGLAWAPDLPEDARERRLAAVQAQARADQDGRAAQAELDRCTQALAELSIEAGVLAQGEVIERLAAGLDAVAHSGQEVGRQGALCDSLEAWLALTAARIAAGTADGTGRALAWWELAAASPSAADRVALDTGLAAVAQLAERQTGRAAQAAALRRAEADGAATLPSAPDPQARRALADALRRAQGLGDAERQIATLGRDRAELAARLARVVADLGATGAADLRRARPLLEAEIAAAREEGSALGQEAKALTDEDALLVRHLDEQRLRESGLAAVGELVTAATLAQARSRRDQGWALVRSAYVDGVGDPLALGLGFDPDRPLADAFEAAQADADRQGDLLRADAERAAVYADCTQRIEQMQGRRLAIAQALAALESRRLDQGAAWAQTLAAAGLPSLDPGPLREWQAGRLAALDLADRLAQMESDLAQRSAELDAVRAELVSALAGVGAGPAGPDCARLAQLLDQATTWEAAATRADAQRVERARQDAQRRAEPERLATDLAQTQADLHRRTAALDAWHQRLALAPGSAPEAVRARLGELDALVRQAEELREARHQRAHHQALVDEFAARAADLAGLLGESLGPLEPWVEGLRRRLALARGQDQRRQALERDRARAEVTLAGAAAEARRQAEALAGLCAAAGVTDAAALPDCEAAAARKGAARAALEAQRRQLAAATDRPESELRGRLAGLDAVAIDAERERTQAEIARLTQAQAQARQVEEQARRALEAVDSGDAAARAREAMESALARCRSAVLPWARLRLAQALLQEALNRFRDKAQAPMVAAASEYFALMTGGRYVRLAADETGERPVLRALREDGAAIGLEAMSEGTADQLYLALRLAALELRRGSHPPMPLVLDDVLVTSDDERAGNILRALARFAGGGQVLVFTHHRHLLEVAGAALGTGGLAVHRL